MIECTSNFKGKILDLILKNDSKTTQKTYKNVTDFVENRYKTLFQRKETISVFSLKGVHVP